MFCVSNQSGELFGFTRPLGLRQCSTSACQTRSNRFQITGLRRQVEQVLVGREYSILSRCPVPDLNQSVCFERQ
jgi:hypothetical protein